MRTPFLLSNGTTTRRLHLRHFSSTPSATTRASKLPQPHRKALSSCAANTASGRDDCSGFCIY
ncbi:MAG TPA: hypothetical protein VEI95_07150, partial [Acidobacteriota bacterium]|nr:hypothetical protein [Acidobacteriota bacterium]